MTTKAKSKTVARPDLSERHAISASRSGTGVEEIKQAFLDHLLCGMGRLLQVATRNDLYTALALTIRDRVLKQGIHTMQTHAMRDARVVSYLSAEYLPGPHIANNLLGLGIADQTRKALEELGVNLDDVLDQEEE